MKLLDKLSILKEDKEKYDNFLCSIKAGNDISIETNSIRTNHYEIGSPSFLALKDLFIKQLCLLLEEEKARIEKEYESLNVEIE